MGSGCETSRLYLPPSIAAVSTLHTRWQMTIGGDILLNMAGTIELCIVACTLPPLSQSKSSRENPSLLYYHAPILWLDFVLCSG